MAVTNYYTIAGEIIGEHTAGQSRLDYVPDALGSVTATINQSLTVESTARYKPYGASLASTGPAPMFGWVGRTGGYRTTGLPHTDVYVRARHVGSLDGAWTTIDPLWPGEQPFGYGKNSPTVRTDRLGLSVSTPLGDCGGYSVGDWCKTISSLLGDDDTYEKIKQCLGGSQSGPVDGFLKAIAAACSKKGPNVCVSCGSGARSNWPTPACGAPCAEAGQQGTGKTVYPYPAPPVGVQDPLGPPVCVGDIKGLRVPGRSVDDTACISALTSVYPNTAGCSCFVTVCRSPSDTQSPYTLAHEIGHCLGYTHIGGRGTDDLLWKLACCLCRANTNNSSSCGQTCQGTKTRWPLG